MKYRNEILVFVLVFLVYYMTRFDATPYNEQTLQAYSFIHGHIQIEPPVYIERAEIGPYKYALHPPLASIVLMPVVAICGMNTNQTLVSVLIGSIDVVFVWILLGKFDVELDIKIWLTVFFAFGTVFWYETDIGSTWAMPMIVLLLVLLPLLVELFGETRPLMLGVWGGLSCLARYDAILVMPVIMLLAWRKRRFTEMLWIAPGFLVFAAIYTCLNEVRYHTIFDTGLAYIPNTHRPWFGIQYLPGNIYTVFFMGPKVDGTFPYFHPSFAGQALTLTSPAFVLALRASFKRAETMAMGAAAILISIPSLVCWANGFSQFGTRHYIQAFPFLLVMMVLGMERKTDQLAKILICISIVLVSFGMWHIHEWGLNGP